MSDYDRFIEWRLYRSRGLVSGAISWFGHDHYTHVDVVGPDNRLWGARSDVIKPEGDYEAIPAGFQKRPNGYDYRDWRQITAFRLTVTPLQEKRFWDFSERQIGKRYDTWRLVETFVFGDERDWRDDSRWFCSEEQAAAAEYALIIPKLWKAASGITPGDFALILNVKGATMFDIAVRPPALACA